MQMAWGRESVIRQWVLGPPGRATKVALYLGRYLARARRD